MNIHTQLHTLGLTQSEIDVYVYILQYGLSTPPQIAKGTKIARTNCYHILQSLKEQLLIAEQHNGKRKVYIARDPQALFEGIERKRQLVKELLPDLRALYTVHTNKPSIQFFEGFEEVKHIYDMSLATRDKKIVGIGSTKQLAHLDSSFYTQYITQAQKRNIVFYDILSPQSGENAGPEMKNIMKGLYDMKLLPGRAGELSTDMLIWDAHIALLSLENPVFGTIITNPPLAHTFSVLFTTLWELLPQPARTSKIDKMPKKS